MEGDSSQNDTKLGEEKIRELIDATLKVKSRAHAPYSNFKVGAALLTKDGRIFTGCNVENSAYSLTTCAERCAITKAVSEGYREFTAIAVTTDIPDHFCPPCGGCRQIMVEFGRYPVIMVRPNGQYKVVPVEELLPHCFTETDLRAGQHPPAQQNTL